MYPNDECPYCPATREDTLHVLSCPNNPDLHQIAMETWERIYRTIQSKITHPQFRNHVYALFPFTLTPQSTDTQFWQRYRDTASTISGNTLKPFRDIETFPPELRNTAFIPRQLRSALQNLRVNKKDLVPLLEEITTLIFQGVQQTIRLRRHYINRTRLQKDMHAHFVRGIPKPTITALIAARAPPQHPPTPSTPPTATSAQSTAAPTNLPDPPSSPPSACGAMESPIAEGFS